jgi:hypothetical protein
MANLKDWRTWPLIGWFLFMGVGRIVVLPLWPFHKIFQAFWGDEL